jgi:hypothetical protein
LLAIALVSPFLGAYSFAHADTGSAPAQVAWATVLHLGPATSAQDAEKGAKTWCSDPEHAGYQLQGHPYAIVALGVSEWYQDVVGP